MSPEEDGAALDSRGQAEIEGRAEARPGTSAAGQASADEPPAGPHGAPKLTEPAATPGTGALPGPKPDDEADAATG